MDYNNLLNKPSINGVTLTSNMTLKDVGIYEMTPDMITDVIMNVFGFIL